MGLRRLNDTVELRDTPSVRGLIAKLSHLVRVVNPRPNPAWMAVPEYVVRPAEAVKTEAQTPRESPAAPVASESARQESEEKV